MMILRLVFERRLDIHWWKRYRIVSTISTQLPLNDWMYVSHRVISFLSLSLYCFPITCWHGNTCIRTNPHNTYLTIKVSCLEASQTQQTWNLHNVYVSVWSFYTCLFPSQCSPWGGRSILGLTLVAYAYLDGLSIPADANRAVEILQDTAHKGPLSSLPDKIGMLRGAKGRPTHEKM